MRDCPGSALVILTSVPSLVRRISGQHYGAFQEGLRMPRCEGVAAATLQELKSEVQGCIWSTFESFGMTY
jgi:hypothetical protein